nr:hypothetical protein Iba_chr13dCG6680 [Ipomoea batatas]
MSPVALHRRRRRVTPEATIAAGSELTKRRPSRCRSIEEKKQGVDRGASSSYATAQHRRCMEDVCRSPDCHPSSSSSPTSIGIALLVAAIASRSLPEEKARSFGTERERRTGRKKERKYAIAAPSTSVVLTAWRKRTQVSLCRCHARRSPPLSPPLAAAAVASKCAAMSPVALHRRRRRVTPEATIAADSELSKRCPSRCRSIEEKKQGVDQGASSSYATSQHRRCMVDVCRSPDCHPSSSSSPTSIDIALLVAAIASRSRPEEKARSFAAERERRTGRKKEVRLHGMPPSLVFTMDAATLSYCLS